MFPPISTTAETCYNTARMMLNDYNIQLWEDETLAPMMYQAHLELQIKLKSRASPVMKGYAELTINPYETQLIGEPDDITSPIQLWEKPSGANNAAYNLMTETDQLPLDSIQQSALVWWMWYQDILMFIGSAVANDIMIFYWRQIPVPQLGTDPIGIINGEQYLAPRIAALAAGSVGEEATSQVMGALAEAQLQFVLSANRSRAGQGIGTSLHP